MNFDNLNITSSNDLINMSDYFKLGIKNDSVILSTDLHDVHVRHGTNNIIINLDRGMKGTHWVALSIQIYKYRLALYCDSFGMGPDNYVIDYCKNNNIKLACTQYICQDIESESCGYFCIAFFKYLKYEPQPPIDERQFKNNKLYELGNMYCNLYEPDTKLNDDLLRNFLNDVSKIKHLNE